MTYRKIQTGGARCPPGVLCMSSSVVIMLVLAIIVGLGFLVLFTGKHYSFMERHMSKRMNMGSQMSIHNEHSEQVQPRIQLDIRTSGGDGRYDRAPTPLRDLVPQLEYPPRGGQLPIPVGIPTRGLPETFQSMGVVKLPDGNVLPLYGRRTATSSDYFNYYTRTDTYNPVPLPLNVKGRDCMDSPGCKELMDGDKVTSLSGQTGSVTLYKYNGPTYIPGLL
jgi:hypothetical protein